MFRTICFWIGLLSAVGGVVLFIITIGGLSISTRIASLLVMGMALCYSVLSLKLMLHERKSATGLLFSFGSLVLLAVFIADMLDHGALRENLYMWFACAGALLGIFGSNVDFFPRRTKK